MLSHPLAFWEELAMAKLKLLLGAAAVFSSAATGPTMAQPVIESPGKCAQYYPDANCQNLGSGNPYTGSYGRGAAAISPSTSFGQPRRPARPARHSSK
jgi:hypothetical protein